MTQDNKLITPVTRTHYQTLMDTAVFHPTAPDQDAIIFVATGQEPVHVTREEFQTAVCHTATALHHFGIQPRDLVIIAHTDILESIYAFWGAMVIGAIPSIFPTLTEKLDPTIYMTNMGRLTRLSQVQAVLTTDVFAPQLQPHVTCPVYSTSRLTSTDRGPRYFETTASPTDIAFLQHSSGTTGLQKGVALSHKAVLNQIAGYTDALHLNADDVIVSWLPLYHDMGLIAGFILPLVQGIPLVLMSPFDWVQHPALLFRAIHDFQGTLCWLPNFAYNHCARRIRQRDTEGVSLASMRSFINCSEPVRHDSHELFLNRFAHIGVTESMLGVSYAMAENTFAVTQTLPGRTVNRDVVDRQRLQEQRVALPVADNGHVGITQVSCGRPIGGTAVLVLDNAGNPLPERHIGELAIKSSYMLTGYYRRPDLQPFQNGWYRTGDTGYLAGGEVYVVGRIKDLIINAGKNIYPQDIEAIVNTVTGVHPGRVVAFGVPDAKEGTELIVVVAEVETADPQAHKLLRREIKQAVARQSSVSAGYVQLVDERWLIKTSSGKIARAANREKWLQERNGTRNNAE